MRLCCLWLTVNGFLFEFLYFLYVSIRRREAVSSLGTDAQAFSGKQNGTKSMSKMAKVTKTFKATILTFLEDATIETFGGRTQKNQPCN